ncbi:hypothetical protein JHK82_046393 [Glycine max]|nr:hypothetical protein JHK85_046834 [Glycine max]KAG5096539.1 hypothetical protein JHK82_046393 [Glycine max]KAG5101330.1 hypothetical protein JHK84_046299 [Glycine max]
MRPLDEKETSTVFDPSYEITLSSVPPLKLLIRFLWVAIFCFEEWLFQGKVNLLLLHSVKCYANNQINIAARVPQDLVTTGGKCMLLKWARPYSIALYRTTPKRLVEMAGLNCFQTSGSRVFFLTYTSCNRFHHIFDRALEFYPQQIIPAMMAVKDIHRCWCFEEAFSHPWRETICLSLRGIWKGGDFVTYRCAKLRICGYFFPSRRLSSIQSFTVHSESVLVGMVFLLEIQITRDFKQSLSSW